MGSRTSQLLHKVESRSALLFLVCADTAALTAALLTSLLLRFDDLSWRQIFPMYVQPHLSSLPVVLLLYLFVFSRFHLYRHVWQFASLETLWAVILANSIGVVGLTAVQAVADGSTFPRSVIVMVWASGIVFTGGVRVGLRVICASMHRSECSKSASNGSSRKRAVILGGGTTGARVLRAVRDDSSLPYDIIGFLDDNPKKHGTYISSVRVLGTFDHLKSLLNESAVDVVIVALPETSNCSVRDHVMECRKRKLPVKVVPHIQDVLVGKMAVHLADFSVEDLLRRPPRDTKVSDKWRYITGKKVLVTGAGGSIGSELCRQIMSLEPACLVLLGHGENSIHNIYQELCRRYPDLADRIHFAIASVSNEARINQVFSHYEPEIVFHAAAHKHVPIMEANEQEAVYNNVLGTNYVARACGLHNVSRMVLISTDKAAEPCCVMGATKWLCEEVIRGAAVVYPNTSYVAVRFGNVLGSRGSVVPVFRDQIKHGGPVTVTHPEMTRYFMTIPEAVRLVLQAGSVGRSGDLYLLDMGDPVKIVDLAEDMIRLCGMEPGVDIIIEFTGTRPGERLHEQLASAREQIDRTPWEGLSLVKRPTYYVPRDIENLIKVFENVTASGTSEDVRRLLRSVVANRRQDNSGSGKTSELEAQAI